MTETLLLSSAALQVPLLSVAPLRRAFSALLPVRFRSLVQASVSSLSMSTFLTEPSVRISLAPYSASSPYLLLALPTE